MVGSATFENGDAIATRVQIRNLEKHFGACRVWHAIEVIVLHDVGHVDAVINDIQVFVSGVVAGHTRSRVGAGFGIEGFVVEDGQCHITVDAHAKITEIPAGVAIIKVIESPGANHVPVIQFHAVRVILVGAEIQLEQTLSGLNWNDGANDQATDAAGIVLHVGKPEVIPFTDINGERAGETLRIGAVRAYA